MRDFLEHCPRQRTTRPARPDVPIDFISFHAKGSPKFVDGTFVMGIENQLRDLDRGFEIVASVPELEGPADHHRRVGPGRLRGLFLAASTRKTGIATARCTPATPRRSCPQLDLAAKHGVNLEGAVTWAFEFENQPYFAGFRVLATNGIDMPVLNVFRMFGLMTGRRAAVDDPAALPLETMVASGVKQKPDVNAFAAVDEHSANILVSNYHDSEKPGPPAPVDLTISGLPEGSILVQHFRIDDDHSNSYEAWKKMGSPQSPTPEQYARLESAGQLQLLESPRWSRGPDVHIRFSLPLHGVSLIHLTWR